MIINDNGRMLNQTPDARHGRFTLRATSLIVTGAMLLNSAWEIGTARAHPGIHGNHAGAEEDTPVAGLRIWSVSGHPVEAAFVLVRDSKVRLERRDGSCVWSALDDLSQVDRQWLDDRREAVLRINTFPSRSQPTPSVEIAQAITSKTSTRADGLAVPEKVQAIYSAFEPFRETLKLRWDDRYFIVESNGMPDHPLMIGIRNWQQQVPLPQSYTGDNAWRIPLAPKLADKLISTKKSLYRGAIALAVNGVPIFNAYNNRGEDAYLIGELDEWGGHCGRADDYHYHVAPLHLEKITGKGRPIAYALDGFPIYGLTEADGSPVGGLDEYNGQFDREGRYHYHATKTYPYINGGLRGVVEVRGDQVEPQPRTVPLRPAGEPLRDAKITDFKALGNRRYRLSYDVRGRPGSIEYTAGDEQSEFRFTDTSGRTTTRTYKRSSPPADDRPPPGEGRRPPPRKKPKP